MRKNFIIFYILIIIYFSNEGLNYGSWWHVEGVFNVADIGNALVWLGIFYLLAIGRKQGVPKSALDWLIPFYLFFVCVQIAIGSLYYNQPLFSSLAGARHQFYFVSYFLFLALFDSPSRIRAVLGAISILAVVALILGLINYFDGAFLNHKWAEGHGVRSGIDRAYLPGMPIISFAFVWVFSRWVDSPVKNKVAGVLSIILLAAHFFRQSRMRIFGVLLTGIGLLIFRKRYKALVISSIVGVVGVVSVGLIMEDNLVLSAFTSVSEDVDKGGGSWTGRVAQLEIAWQEFTENPYIGSGASTLRLDSQQISAYSREEIAELAAKADLGYLSWAKAYGIVGILWLISFFSVLFLRARIAIKKNTNLNGDITSFSMAFLVFIITTFVTLNHMMFAHSILLVCITAAIIVRMSALRNEDTETSTDN